MKEGAEPNFHQVARERAAMREAHREANPGMKEILAEELEALDQQASQFSIEEQGGLSRAKAKLHEQRKAFAYEEEAFKQAVWLNEPAIAEELGPTYQALADMHEKLDDMHDFEMRALREQPADLVSSNIKTRILDRVRREKGLLEESITTLEQANPTEAHARELVNYKKGLHHEGHIAIVPSVRQYLDEIGNRMIIGKPMFLHGPTGTGKTSLARYAAEHFTGQRAEMVYCNPQTREANIWGRQGIRPAEGEAGRHGAIQTVDIYGPLARAIKEGRVVIFDEFTALPLEQQVFIKGICASRPGDTVNIIGNGEAKIAPGFQMILTANLKSEKNPERQELRPEIVREFEQNNLEINYTSKEEAYDIMLARLMNPDGSVDLSLYDLNTTLPALCRAITEVQTAYNDQTSNATARLTESMDASGKRPGLKKLVFTQGTVENILDGWKTERRMNLLPPSFAEYLDQRLKTALTFKEYPLADRVLVAKILAAVGLLRTVTAKELDLPETVFAFDAAKKLRVEKVAEIKQQSRSVAHVPLKILADLDPFKQRQQRAAAVAEGFLSPEERDPEPPTVEVAPLTFRDFMADTYRTWYSQKTAAEIDQAANRGAIQVLPADLNWSARKGDTDPSKFGEYTLNPETVGIDWEHVPASKIKIIDLPQTMRGKSLVEVGQYILNNYGARHHVPGIEFWKYVYEHPDKAPQALKDGNYHFFFGAVLRAANGNWHVPYVRWHDGAPYRNARWLGHEWDSNYRVVLLEK